VALALPVESAVIDSEVDEISFPNSSTTLTAREVALEAGSPVAWNVTSTSSPSTKVLILGRLVSALKLCGTLNWVLLVPDKLALGTLTGALDEEPLEVVGPEPADAPLLEAVPALGEEPLAVFGPEPADAPLEEVVPALGEEPLLEAVLEPDEEPLIEVVPEPDEELPAVVVPELGAAPTVEVAPEPDKEPGPGVPAAAGATFCVVPLLAAALLPLHAASARKAAQIVGAAAQFLSDKSLFISVILRCDFCPRIMLTELNRTQLSLRGDCLRSATISVAA
jgi:hypothetical protein